MTIIDWQALCGRFPTPEKRTNVDVEAGALPNSPSFCNDETDLDEALGAIVREGGARALSTFDGSQEQCS